MTEICGGCGLSTERADEKITALGKRWHPACFTCGVCDTPLQQEFSLVGDKACHDSCAKKLTAQSATKCGKCEEAISGTCLTLLGKKWHPLCLLCAYCLDVLTEAEILIHEDLPFHPQCFQKGDGCARCPGCHKLCDEEFMEALGSQWHPECFVCGQCNQVLEGAFTTSGGIPYHGPCLMIKQSADSSCHACKRPLGANAVQAVGYDWHPECFKCAWCGKEIDKQYTTDIDTNVFHAPCLTEKRRVDKENRDIVMKERVRIWTDLKMGKEYTAPNFSSAPKTFSYTPTISFDITNSLISDKQLREEFKKYDVDGTGLLDMQEFIEVYKAFEDFGLPRTDTEVHNILERFKQTPDGKLNYNEFCILMLRLAKA